MRGILLLLLFVLGCGVKSPPRPPDLLLPDSPRGASLKVREGRPFLEWSPPEDSEYLAYFVVLMREGCAGCPGDFVTVARIPFQRGRKKYRWEIEPPGEGETLIFQIRGENRWGYRGKSSRDLILRWRTPPPPPAHLEARGGDRCIRVRWSPVSEAEGYAIYRRKEGKSHPPDPIVFLPGEEFLDRELRNGVTFCYLVRGVVWSEGIAIEGRSSEEVCATPRDLVPPPPPSGVIAMKVKDRVEVDWFPVEAEPIRGYHVWRGRCGEGLKRITDSPVRETFFYDRPPERGCWVYGVTAVDASPRGNESEISRTVTVYF
ncbi:MAG: hypothetical protein DRG31_04210 [Deltaproteobacteria bacterium]|nr:MAG: hypothetical protein DRG31_04210 [Deltaproteobacteria bacterium]